MRALELYAGIGGFSAASCGEADVAAAIELSPTAIEVYRKNFAPTPAWEKNLDGLDAATLDALGADLWWLSPPCQPFTKRGAQKDDQDPRAKTFLHAIELIDAVRPKHLALENVPAFDGSRVQARLREVLAKAGYTFRESILCPTELGIPNRRARYYLVASREALKATAIAARPPRPLKDFLGTDAPEYVDPRLVERYAWAMQILDPADPSAIATCFTSAYGRSPVRSGAYLYEDDRVRLFSPREIARLLGFPETFVLPRDRPYALLGNSLSIYAVREILLAFAQ